MLAASEIRPKNQITLPFRVVKEMGLQPGDRLVFEVDPEDPDLVHVRRLRDSYLGVARGIYGSPEEVEKYIEDERQSWER